MTFLDQSVTAFTDQRVSVNFSSGCDFSDILGALHNTYAFQKNLTIFSLDKEYYFQSEDEKNTILDIISNGGRKVLTKKNLHNNQTYFYIVWKHAWALIFKNTTSIHCSFHSYDDDFIKNIDTSLSSFEEEKKPIGQVRVISVNSQGNLIFQAIGVAGLPLVEINYSTDIIKDYKYIISNLNSISPSGRIVLLSGEPGTGKTHIIRAIINDIDIDNCMVVMIPPDMVTQLSNPSFIPVLLQHKISNDSNSILFILEDADSVLVSRARDNINAIQALLNLSDGILGSLLDIRIVATTNAKKLEIDPAILRAGRLCKKIEVGLLDANHSKKILKNLLPEQKDLDVKNKMSLADVYLLARENGWTP